jgi:hypothetical protein
MEGTDYSLGIYWDSNDALKQVPESKVHFYFTLYRTGISSRFPHFVKGQMRGAYLLKLAKFAVG